MCFQRGKGDQNCARSLSIYLLSIYLSIHLSLYLSIYLSIFLSISHLSIYLASYMYVLYIFINTEASRVTTRSGACQNELFFVQKSWSFGNIVLSPRQISFQLCSSVFILDYHLYDRLYRFSKNFRNAAFYASTALFFDFYTKY